MYFKLNVTEGMEQSFLMARAFASVGGWHGITTDLNVPLQSSNTRAQRVDIYLKEGFKATKIEYNGTTQELIKGTIIVSGYPDNSYYTTGVPDSAVDIFITIEETAPQPEPVITTETETVTEPIPFETVNQDNPNLEIGQSNVLQEGVNGERTIVYTVTYTDGVETERVETSSTVTTEPVNKIVENGTKEPVVTDTIRITDGTNATSTFTDSNGQVFNAETGVSITLPVGMYTWTVTGNEGFYVNRLYRLDSYGREIDYEITPNSKTVTATVEFGGRIDYLGYTTDIFEEETETPVPEPDVTGFNHLYLMDKTAMSSLANDRFTAPSGNPGDSIDLGVNIINILELPFPLKPEFLRTEKNVILGISTLNTIGVELVADRYTIDFGEIVIPHKYNNSYDFLNTEIKLHLPFIDTFTLPVEYSVGQTIKIKYSIDLYTGDTDIIISSSKLNDEIFHSQQVKIGRNIPFVRKSGESVISSSSQNGLNNEVYSPFVEVIRNKPYNAGGQFNTPVPVLATLTEMKGFIRVEDIHLQTNATQEEQNTIRNLLREGVFIHG